MAGLGKGLDALFGGTPIHVEEPILQENETLKNLKIIDVEPNRDQPRKNFNQEALEELAESIKEYGIIQPIVVSHKDGYYSIVAGERRWRAAKLAGLTEIPAIVRDDDEQTNKEIALIENIQREDLNAYEKAMGMKNLMDKYGMTQEQVSQKIGKSRSSVANYLRLLTLDERVLDLVKEGKLSEGHCRTLITIPDGDKQIQQALKIIEKGISVRDMEKKRRAARKPLTYNTKYQYLYDDIEDTFQGFFGTKVSLNQKSKGGGKVIIEYHNNEDLERMLGLLKGE